MHSGKTNSAPPKYSPRQFVSPYSKRPTTGIISFTNEASHLKLLKKYPNRRIYDTSSSSYITVSDIKQMVLNYEAFQVIDSKTGNDLTRTTLLQIITDLENEGNESLLTNKVLMELIRFYGDSMSGVMGKYVEQALCTILGQQDKVREKLKNTLDPTAAIPLFTEATKQYTDFWGNLFTPNSKKDPKNNE